MITIAIPFYSNLPYLKVAVESALAQTSDQYQILISDDCGPEGEATKTWVATLDQTKVRYVRQPKNLGLAGNWNYCLDAADTPLVTLLHADDMLEPGYVAGMLAAAAAYPEAAFLHCQTRIIDENGKDTFSFPDFYKKVVAPKATGFSTIHGDEGLAGLMKGCYIMCPTICYRKAVIGPRRFSLSWKMVPDLDFYAGVLFDGQTIVGVPERLYSYRRHGANQTSVLTASLVRFEEEVALYDQVAAKAQRMGWIQTAKHASAKSIIKKNLLYCTMKDLLAFRISAAVRKTRYLKSIQP